MYICLMYGAYVADARKLEKCVYVCHTLRKDENAPNWEYINTYRNVDASIDVIFVIHV
jgi:hypothetical protein